MPYWVSRDCGVCCAPECVSVTRLITHIKCHPSLTQRRRVVSRAVTSSSGSLSRYCVLCVSVSVSVCVCLSVPGWAAPVMAAAPANPRTGSLKAQLPPCYYEGYLEKRGAKEKVSDHYDMSNTLFDHIIARSGIWDAWHTLHARIVWIWARFDGSAVLILSVCQVTTQMLIMHFNSNINVCTSRRCSVPCVMALSDISINVITHIWALILPVGCFKFSAAALIVDTP